jgi:aminoglycoside phosphotransferase (APT) family kinase protein
MIARIPYPMTQPKLYAVASEVATMDLLASAGIPVPEVYGYAPTSDNAAKTQYIFMEYIRGTILADVWSELVEKDINALIAQLTQLESHMMSIPFPAGGSLYYPKDLETLAEKSGFPLEYEKFCLGPDANLRMWSSGRRSQLKLDRRPRTPLLSLIPHSLTDFRR